MSADTQTLPPRQEKMLLGLLMCINFTHVMDYVIIMPLGARMMERLHLSPAQYGYLVAAYSLAAALSGLLGGFVLDRFSRKQALLSLYLGFTLATFACGFAPNYPIFLLARFAAGAFGGVAGSVVYAIVSDVIPSERRGRAMGLVMSAFPIASILGIPFAMWLTTLHGWPAPFLMLGALSAAVLLLTLRHLPLLPHQPAAQSPWLQMKEILSHPLHQRAFLMSGFLVFAGGCVIPFMAPSMVANNGLSEHQLTWIYVFGGAATLFSTNLIGYWSDKASKTTVLLSMSLLCSATILILTNLHGATLWQVLVVTTLFTMSMAGRFPPAMALITNAVEARYRGGFMSVNSAVQQAANSLASSAAGWFLATSATGQLTGYPRTGLLAVISLGVTIVLAFQVRRLAPATPVCRGEGMPAELCE